jgi:hypothetical protein
MTDPPGRSPEASPRVRYPRRGIPEEARLANLRDGGVRYFPVGQLEIGDAERETAAWYLQAYGRDEVERADQLRKRVAGLDPGGGPVVAMLFNAAFAPLFRNWARSCDRFGVDARRRTLVFPTDAESAACAVDEGYAAHYEDGSPVLETLSPSRMYGDEPYARFLFCKSAIVQSLLGIGVDVLFQDVDVVWLRDPFPALSEAGSPDSDVQVMFDGINSRFQPMYANSGFVHLRNTACTRHLWTLLYEGYDKVLGYRSQQEPFNVLLTCLYHRGLRVDVLPEQTFANGHLFHVDRGRVPEEACVAHCSWTRGLEHKLEKYRIHGLWYLDE